jgi:hypothetical protein
MVVATERGRDAHAPDPTTPKGVLSMQLQCTTSPLFGDPRLPPHFWSKVRVLPNGCWEWTASRISGYGQFARTLPRLAHRRAYERLVGPVPEGLELDHLCRNRACVNTDHLEPVTGSENAMRGLRPIQLRSKRYCPHGHPYSGSNLYIRTDGARECRICRREHVRRHARKAQL